MVIVSGTDEVFEGSGDKQVPITSRVPLKNLGIERTGTEHVSSLGIARNFDGLDVLLDVMS
jgi:hypothetical protein